MKQTRLFHFSTLCLTLCQLSPKESVFKQMSPGLQAVLILPRRNQGETEKMYKEEEAMRPFPLEGGQ